MTVETFLEEKIRDLFILRLHVTHHHPSIASRGSREPGYNRFRCTKKQGNQCSLHPQVQIVHRYSAESADRHNQIDIAKEG